MGSLDDFAARLVGLGNIYPAPTTKPVTPPAVVLRPDEPWLEPGGYGWDDENFVALCVVGAANPEATSQLHELARQVIEVTNGPYFYKESSEPFVYQQVGIDLLAMRIRITFSGVPEGAYS